MMTNKECLERLEKLEKAIKIYQKYTRLTHDNIWMTFSNYKECYLLGLTHNCSLVEIPQEEYDLLKEVFELTYNFCDFIETQQKPIRFTKEELI